MSRKPVIGISWGAAPVMLALAAVVTQVRSAGGVPLVLRDFAEDADVAALLARVDGLVIMGNDCDISPALYGQDKHAETVPDVDTARARFEGIAIGMALEGGMPLLGICGGMQRMNVNDHARNGGTLHQHVPDIAGHDDHRQRNVPPYQATQAIQIMPDTLLAQIAGEASVYENTFHHQAVDRIHKEFQACAHAADGIIEAIEPRANGRYGGQFAIGVQWHPEFGASDIGAKLAARLVETALIRKKNHGG